MIVDKRNALSAGGGRGGPDNPGRSTTNHDQIKRIFRFVHAQTIPATNAVQREKRKNGRSSSIPRTIEFPGAVFGSELL